jgi:hypothetical protein
MSRHAGVLDDREAFPGALYRFAAVIDRGDDTLPGAGAPPARRAPGQCDRRCVSHSWKAPMWCSEGTSTPPLA